MTETLAKTCAYMIEAQKNVIANDGKKLERPQVICGSRV